MSTYDAAAKIDPDLHLVIPEGWKLTGARKIKDGDRWKYITYGEGDVARDGIPSTWPGEVPIVLVELPEPTIEVKTDLLIRLVNESDRLGRYTRDDRLVSTRERNDLRDAILQAEQEHHP